MIYSRPDMEGGKREKPTEKENKGGKTKKPTEKEGGFRDNPGAALVVGALAKGEYFPFTTFHRLSGPITLTVYSYTLRETDTFMLIVSGLSQMNLSALLAPCGVVTYFSGGGAEWRGKRKRQDDLLKIDPTGDGGFFHGEDLWVDPPLANWGLNIHAIDLRDVGNTRNAVQCSCAYYGKTNPGTPQQFDQSPRRGGGIECCGAEARGPVLNDSNEPVPIALTYEVRWAPLSEALATLKSSEQFVKTLNQLQRGAPKGATLMMSSSPDLDGASCAGEYNARPCPGAYEYDESIAGVADAGANVAPLEKITAEAKAWAARDNDSASGAKSPRNQKCLDVESPKPGYVLYFPNTYTVCP